jgi:hypothetical protein
MKQHVWMLALSPRCSNCVNVWRRAGLRAQPAVGTTVNFHFHLQIVAVVEQFLTDGLRSVRLNVNVRETHSMLLDVLSEQHEQHQDLFNSNRLTFSG